ncbi:hypothetical protein WJX72_008413 [[Myrmecia] bisecta]|uniref:F-box domain-containing protein n=1 Tax=[Myrmecia] bisecta TaxID=41462 RepID=A0AAW1PYY5_9CHLO
MAIIVHPQHLQTYLQYMQSLAAAPKPVARAPAHWEHLPLDILHNIATHLHTAKELVRFEQICKSSRAAAQDDNLWRKLCCTKFNTPPHSTEKNGSMPWKELYRYNHRVLYDVLMFRRPEKLVHLGNGVILINMGVPVVA